MGNLAKSIISASMVGNALCALGSQKPVRLISIEILLTSTVLLTITISK